MASATSNRNNLPPALLNVLAQNQVMVANVVQALEQPFWSTYTYPAAGPATNIITFFQQAKNSGGLTPSMTNMLAGGNFPNPNHFLVTGVEVQFFSGVPFTDAGAPGKSAADDWFAVMTGPSVFKFKINDIVYYEDTPLVALPPSYDIHATAAVSTTASAATDVAGYASASGFRRTFGSGIILEPNTQFSVEVAQDSPIALPSGVAGKMICKLRGIFYRLAQ